LLKNEKTIKRMKILRERNFDSMEEFEITIIGHNFEAKKSII